MRGAVFLLLAMMLAGCSGGASVVQGEGRRIGEIQAEPYDGPLKRIAVAPMLDKTGTEGNSDIVTRIGLLTGEDSSDSAKAALSGIRDLLTTALFNTGYFILLEREGLNEVMTEQAFAADEGKLPAEMRQQLEGADLLLLGAVTAFDPGESGGLAFPVPVPLNDRGDFGVLDVEMRTAYLGMDLRLVDVKTGRIVASTAVEGRARKFGMAMAGLYTAGGGHIRLPGILSAFNNTPMETAALKMVDKAAHELVYRSFPKVMEQHRREQEERFWEHLE
jgi:curli biogenesis system outer membrane secretion channel CsgG